MDVVEVDGSYGEGGGQILRTSAAFSIALQRPIHVTNIRAGRESPGLRPQHASSLEILSAISGGALEGCRVGSSEISFRPGKVRGVSLAFDMMTAASVTLVLQAVLPAVSLSGCELSLKLVGGTDVPWSPTFDYFALVVREAFSRVGVHFSVEATERGYYPKGGGMVTVSVEKSGTPKELVLVDPPRGTKASVVSRCGNLPEHVARRQVDSAVSVLQSNGVEIDEVNSSLEKSRSPGSSLLVYQLASGRVVGADGIGSRGKSAESVGAEVAGNFVKTTSSEACIDSNLADMLAPLLSIAKRESRLRIPGPTEHLSTSLHVAELFTGCRHSLMRDEHASILTITPLSLQ